MTSCNLIACSSSRRGQLRCGQLRCGQPRARRGHIVKNWVTIKKGLLRVGAGGSESCEVRKSAVAL